MENQTPNQPMESAPKSCCGGLCQEKNCAKCWKMGLMIVGLLLAGSIFYAGYQFSKISQKPAVISQVSSTTPTPDEFVTTKGTIQLSNNVTKEYVLVKKEGFPVSDMSGQGQKVTRVPL